MRVCRVTSRAALVVVQEALLGTKVVRFVTAANLTALNDDLATTPVTSICTVVRDDFHELGKPPPQRDEFSTSDTPFTIDTDMPVALGATSRALRVAAIRSLARGFIHPRGALTTRAVTDASASRPCEVDG